MTCGNIKPERLVCGTFHSTVYVEVDKGRGQFPRASNCQGPQGERKLNVSFIDGLKALEGLAVSTVNGEIEQKRCSCQELRIHCNILIFYGLIYINQH